MIAGQYDDTRGPAHTFSPMQVWDLQLQAGSLTELPAAEGWNTALVVLHGSVRINDQHAANEGQLVILDAQGSGLAIEASTDTTVLLLSGEPISEPVVGHGPFVMNSWEEIDQAIVDFNSGNFGRITH